MFSASFEAPEQSAELRPADEQLPVTFGDVPFGDPALSSNRYEADIVAEKPAAEVIVNGTAYAPNGKPVREMQVGLGIGSVRKVLNVAGDRIYDAGNYSAPHPFRTMPVVYERAFGGTTADGRMDPRNPVGVGFHHARSADPARQNAGTQHHVSGRTFSQPFRSAEACRFWCARPWLATAHRLCRDLRPSMDRHAVAVAAKGFRSRGIVYVLLRTSNWCSSAVANKCRWSVSPQAAVGIFDCRISWRPCG